MKVKIPTIHDLDAHPYWSWSGDGFTGDEGERISIGPTGEVIEVTLCPDQLYHNASYTVSLMKHTAANWQVLSEPNQPAKLTCTCEKYALLRNGCTCGEMQRERALRNA